jgi:hypothetical protein
MPMKTDTPNPPAADIMHGYAQEAISLFECACETWIGYLGAMAARPTPAGLVEANARLTLDFLDLCGRAAGGLLARGGLRAPLLNAA